LPVYNQLSSRKISRILCISHTLVNEVRAELAASSRPAGLPSPKDANAGATFETIPPGSGPPENTPPSGSAQKPGLLLPGPLPPGSAQGPRPPFPGLQSLGSVQKPGAPFPGPSVRPAGLPAPANVPCLPGCEPQVAERQQRERLEMRVKEAADLVSAIQKEAATVSDGAELSCSLGEAEAALQRAAAQAHELHARFVALSPPNRPHPQIPWFAANGSAHGPSSGSVILPPPNWIAANGGAQKP
jgi:hypothetical protein